MNLAGTSVSNNGPLYIGGNPWYESLHGGSYDNVQIHNKALTEA
jgi:hypothetical protein